MSEEKRDFVKEAYECFIKNAEGLDPTDPVQAVAAYFERNATDELKARCKAEGKDAKKCWTFIEAVARKVGGNCHIDPGAVYAIAMHYFEDVPVDWDSRKPKKEKAKAESAEVVNQPVGNVDKSVDKPKKGNGKRGTVNGKAKKPKSKQGFFFELLDAPEAKGGAE
jgi:hypothetical protein